MLYKNLDNIDERDYDQIKDVKINNLVVKVMMDNPWLSNKEVMNECAKVCNCSYNPALIQKKEISGYHLHAIATKGEYGAASKIREELEELEEAIQQDNKILILCELSDLYGALEAVATNQGVT